MKQSWFDNKIRATTVLGVIKDGRCVMAGDGQVTVGETIMKHGANKVRAMYKDQVLVGFAGAAADAFNLFERLEEKLGIKAGGTTDDLQFSLEAVRCLGCCGLAPVFTVNADLYEKVTQSKVSKIIEKYRE